jgi:hypothetical protein
MKMSKESEGTETICLGDSVLGQVLQTETSFIGWIWINSGKNGFATYCHHAGFCKFTRLSGDELTKCEDIVVDSIPAGYTAVRYVSPLGSKRYKAREYFALAPNNTQCIVVGELESKQLY